MKQTVFIFSTLFLAFFQVLSAKQIEYPETDVQPQQVHLSFARNKPSLYSFLLLLSADL